MLATMQPYILLGAWILLGGSVGFVAIHTLFGVARGVRTVWPIAALFILTGYLALGAPGVLVGLLASAAVGWYVGRA
jgi:hypothetical protein